MKILDEQQLERGVDAALHQARGLLADSKLIAEKSQSATATALAFMALEEVGKAVNLRNASIDPPTNWSRFWSQLRNHRMNVEYAVTFHQTIKSIEVPEYLSKVIRVPLATGNLDFEALGIPVPKALTNFREEALYVFFDAYTARFIPPIAFPPDMLQETLRWVENLAYYVDLVFLGDVMKGAKVLTGPMADRIAWVTVTQLVVSGNLVPNDKKERFDSLRASFQEFVGRES